VRKLLIANRGEIARRVLRSARERGYLVAVVSTPEDADALVRSEADAVVEVSSFLDVGEIVSAATTWGANMVHPGYGFLSESAELARRIEDAGITFVGPSPESMERLGNKESAKTIASAAGVPILASVRSDELDELAERGIEPPYLVKAAGGGGGRGMRIVETRAQLPAALSRASEEARAGFGDPTVFVERYLKAPRHIEIQVFGDGDGGGVALGERECSMQRRYQKVIEESPSPVVDASLRERMSAAALALVETTQYRGAGTVEFLLEDDGHFYFLEVNTRLQVEHPVTEEVYGVDLVAAQLELAEGDWPSRLDSRQPSRWAIEARVLAEDPRADFLPTPGPLRRYREPSGVGVRVDSGVAEGGFVRAQFDSMIAKVIAVGGTREAAIEILTHALESMVIHGIVTNLPFLQSVIRHPDFRSGSLSTAWIGEHLEELNRSLLPETLETRLQTVGFREQLSLSLRGNTPGTLADARFRSLGNRRARVGSPLERSAIHIDVDRVSGDVVLTGRDLPHPVEGVATVVDATAVALTVQGETLRLEDPRALSHRRVKLAASDGEVRAPMAGKVLELRVEEGASVEEGQVLAVVESMKMQLEIHAPFNGRVSTVLVERGQVLDGPDLIAVVIP
jgi:acetyl/propionyl-CoA carboxylase alpha subunit